MNFMKIKFNEKLKEIKVNSLENNDKSIQKICRNLQSIKMITILIPSAEATTTNIEDIFNYQYHSIEEFKISDILSKSVINGYVNTGEMTCVSINKNENCQILLSNRKLTLELDRDLYYSIGAVHLSKYQTKKENDLLIFEIDLTTCTDIDNIRKELDSKFIDKIEVTFLWIPDDDEICRSSIAKYFTNLHYNVKALKILNNYNFLYRTSLPKLPEDEDSYNWIEKIECIEMMMLDCELSDNSFSSYQLPEDNIQVDKVQTLYFKGLISPAILESLLKEIQSLLKQSYIAISVNPYSKLQSNTYSKSFIITSENIHVAE